MDRDRDRGFDDRYGGQSYRPGDRAPPRRSRSPPGSDMFRPNFGRPRSPPRPSDFRPALDRPRSPLPYEGRPARQFDSPARINPNASTYRPGRPVDLPDERRWKRSRSRSPPRGWEGRPRSRSRSRSREPMGRRLSPRRSPPGRPFAPASYAGRPRSPLNRGPSPVRGGRMSPAWRDRPRSPAAWYAPPRPRSPDRRPLPQHARHDEPYRRSRSPGYRDDGRRPRSISPGGRQLASGISSGTTSRKSSPPVHPSRLHLQNAGETQSVAKSMHSPLPQPRFGPRDSLASEFRPRSPPRCPGAMRGPSPVNPGYQSLPRGGKTSWANPRDGPPPLQPQGNRSPLRQTDQRPIAPPTGPKRSPNVNISVLSAPSQPRGPAGPGAPSGPSFNRRPSIPHPAPISTQISVTNSTSPSPRTSTIPTNSPSLQSAPIPTGPRSAQGPWFRSQTQPSQPAPRPARYTGPQIVAGGKLLPPVTSQAVQDRLKKIDTEREVIERELKEKLVLKRKTMTEWERLDREVGFARLRSELAEQQLGGMGF